MNEQLKCEQLENLGIDVDLIFNILGRLDNMNLLMSYISSELENYQTEEDLQKRPSNILLDEIKRVQQLTFIFDNEFKEAYNNAELLNRQINFWNRNLQNIS